MISPKWSKLARNVLGNSKGIHCHWCKNGESDVENGEYLCRHPQSNYNGKQIRILEGDAIAKKCKLFELNPWYTDDKNYDEYFEER